MTSVIEMQDMRYLNLFEQVTRVRTRFCFKYNETIFFCVQKELMSKSIGKNATNIRRINEILNKKIKVIPYPEGIEDIKDFIQNIVDPVNFKNVEISNSEVILSANTQSKAALIGRNKRRLFEMQKIIKDFFGKEFKIV
jgi:NusA-like KH domain protein